MNDLTQFLPRLRRGIELKTYVLLSLLLVALIASTYNLEYFPATWFDEGWWLQIPRNLVLYGQYATLSAEGFRPYDTVVAVSPAFYLPIAAAFKIGGIGLFQARLVIAIYFLVTCLLVYAVTQKLYRPTTGLLALALFIFIRADDNFTSAVLLGRQVMAEIPAVCFLMAAIYCWLRAFERRPSAFLWLSGILFGLAMSTKAQFLLIVPPTLVVLGLIDRLYYGQKRYAYYALPLAVSLGVLALQYLFVFLILGPDDSARLRVEYAAASGPQVRVLFSPAAMLTGLKLFFRSHYLIWGVLGLAYALIRCARRNPENIRECLLWVFGAGWFTWFLVASVGWARYTFPALVVSYIPAARLFEDLAGEAGWSLGKVRAMLNSRALASAGRALGVWLALALLLSYSSWPVIQGVFSRPDRSAQEFAAYIDAHVGGAELIETWEWEIDFLTKGRLYHHPPTSLLNSLIAHVNLGAPYDPKAYDFQQYGPTYIVVGPFAKWTGLYPADFLKNGSTLISSIGEYDLYRVNRTSRKSPGSISGISHGGSLGMPSSPYPASPSQASCCLFGGAFSYRIAKIQ